MKLGEYYEYYLMLHQHPKCRLLHFLGQWFTILSTALVVHYQVWYLAAALPFLEKNIPAAFSNPIYAKISDWIMFKDILLGKLRIW